MSAIEKNQELWANSKPAATAPHDCGVCHECERELSRNLGEVGIGPVCLSFYCKQFALTDEGAMNPYFGPCPIEAGQ